MRDNQNRDLEAAKRKDELDAKPHEAGRVKMEKAISEMVFPDWQIFEGVNVLRIGDSKFIAAPRGSKKAKRFDVINIEKRTLVCQLKNTEVRGWLVRVERKV